MLRELYHERIRYELMNEFKLKNIHQVPYIEKVVLNCGVKDAKENIKAIDVVVEEFKMITGQKPVVTRAKKSIAGFKLKEGTPIGVVVTLRGKRMYEFLERFLYAALPRIRDFKGFEVKSIDKFGNFNFGVSDEFIFPEILLDKVDKPRGLNITICIRNTDVGKTKRLLELLGFPFRGVKQVAKVGG
ncbi:MAG: 50S ribosomal protein L5 [bacterium]|nr:50S ribosomal protein L5 [bacterium]